MLFNILFAIAAILPSSLADITFSSPAAGTSVSGTALDIEWTDSGSPALTTFSLFLCAGGNDVNSFIQLVTLKDAGDFSTISSLSVTVQPGVGASTTNAYFLKMIAAASSGSATYYSDRFTLSSMTGTFPATVIAGLKTVSGTSGPANTDQTVQVNAGAAAGTEVASGSFGVAYTMQTDSIRYAPMPPVPLSKITAKAASMQYPTSSWTAYTTAGGAPNAEHTYTQSQTLTVASMEATIAAAGQPTDTDMQKFLNRWKD